MNIKKRNTYIAIIFVIALVVGIGYAVLNSSLNIAGNTTIGNPDWDIHFENINVTAGSVEATTPTITNATNVTYAVVLNQPGDFYEFTVDVKNSGSIDAMIESVSKTGLTTEQKKYMNYTAKYTSDIDISEKQELKAGNKERIIVRVDYKQDINASDLPSENKAVNLSLNINYEQADDSAIEISHPICKRATNLHTEICNQTSSSHYCSGGGYNTGDTITYGNLGTTGTLASGDAFDCDVNGDELYNPTNERFYYVSNLDSNSNYGVLVYYNNVSSGQANNTATYAYDSSNAPAENGPITAVNQLPTTSSWKNVKLSNFTRQIKDDIGTYFIDFSYSGYSARLLTTNEVQNACNIASIGTYTVGELDTCKYLMENTQYSNNTLTVGYWLETIRSYAYQYIWQANGFYRYIDDGNDASQNTYLGVRPVIEVPKSKMSY